MDAVILDLMAGRLAAGTRALINQVTVDANVDVFWLDESEVTLARADALIAVVDGSNPDGCKRLARRTKLPLVALLAGETSEEHALQLTRWGILECVMLAELTPTRLRRAVRMAVARSGSRPTVEMPTPVDPHAAVTVNLAEACPHCRAPIKPEFVVCRICGARLTL